MVVGVPAIVPLVKDNPEGSIPDIKVYEIVVAGNTGIATTLTSNGALVINDPKSVPEGDTHTGCIGLYVVVSTKVLVEELPKLSVAKTVNVYFVVLNTYDKVPLSNPLMFKVVPAGKLPLAKVYDTIDVAGSIDFAIKEILISSPAG
jgi:hypothetical protein